MTPEQKIKYLVLANAGHMDGKPFGEVTAEFVEEAFARLDEEGDLQDATEEVREGKVETGLRTDWSRHYESKAVAAQLPDGSWVGWTYWYGGGKHGEPESVDWMDQAYDLSCVEEQKLVTVRTFSKADAAEA